MTLAVVFRNTLKTLGVFFSFVSFFPLHAGQIKNVGITQIVDHPSLNAIREGILEQLPKEGFVEGDNLAIVFENAQGNPTTATQIAQKFAGLSLDVVVPITTPSAQAVAQHIKKTPVVFAAITDPKDAKLVPSLEHPGGYITGLADIPPLEKQLDFIRKHIPHLKNLGVIYNPGEANSDSFLKNLRKLAQQKGLTVIAAPAPKSADVQAAANHLATQVDAIFIGNDNTVVSGLEPLVKICLNMHIPLFVSDPESVKRGALAAYAYDQHAIGVQAGKMIAAILRGKKPETMPVQVPTDLKVYVNPRTAEKLDITIHEDK